MRLRVGPALLVVALLAAVSIGGAGGFAAGPPHPAGVGLSLTADPTNGSAPLVVAFLASVTPSSATATFDWTFGDGTSYSETVSGSSSPAHQYSSVGVYQANVSVTSSAGDANASIVIDVVAENLVASISATPTGGTAPLTVHFVAEISGGTGTYESILWNFGDGDSGSGPDLNYTFPIAGTFLVNLTVTDSSGHSVSDQRTISVASTAPATGSSSPANPLVQSLPFLLAAAAFLAAAAVAAVAYRSMVRRRAGAIEAPAGATGESATTAPAPDTGAAAVAGSPVPGPVRGSGPAAALDESRRLSERILIHLLWYGRSSAEGSARAEASQQGMAKALNSGQNTISKALSRLIDAGAVRVELQHVPGAPRRVKTYSLTPRGEAVARSLTRGPGDPRPGPGPEP